MTFYGFHAVLMGNDIYYDTTCLDFSKNGPREAQNI